MQTLADRRKHSRHPIETQVTVLFSKFWRLAGLDQLVGWTHNVSEGGVCFSLPYHVTETELVLHIDYEGMGAEYVLASAVHVQQLETGWQYHCQIERTLSTVGPFDCFQETDLDPVGSNYP